MPLVLHVPIPPSGGARVRPGVLLCVVPAAQHGPEPDGLFHAVRGRRHPDLRRPVPVERLQRHPLEAPGPQARRGARLRLPGLLHGPQQLPAHPVRLQHERRRHDPGTVRRRVRRPRLHLRGRRVLPGVLLLRHLGRRGQRGQGQPGRRGRLQHDLRG